MEVQKDSHSASCITRDEVDFQCEGDWYIAYIEEKGISGHGHSKAEAFEDLRQTWKARNPEKSEYKRTELPLR